MTQTTDNATRTSPASDPTGPRVTRIPAGKRALDLLCLFLALPIVLPLMGLIALFIRLVSPGPIFFRQTRIGHRATPFTCLKFRTMVVNAETGSHQQHLQHLVASGGVLRKMDEERDARVIRGGGLLRATGLDELPQLINIWRGEMSLIGPRPCLPYELELYSPEQRARFDTAPGLTGLWQVNGKNKTTFVEMIELDIRYAHSRSLWLDLWIILKTPFVLAGQVCELIARRWPFRRPTPAPLPPSRAIPVRSA